VGQGRYCPKHYEQNADRRTTMKYPIEFTNLVARLLEASDAVAAYCSKNGEHELFQFFESGNGADGLRLHIDEAIDAASPTFNALRQ
jgi:hypothetical protein